MRTVRRSDGQTVGRSENRTGGRADRLLASAAILGLGAVLSGAPLAAQESHVVVISGISGGSEYAERFRGWANQMIQGAEKLGVPAANVVYLAEEAPEAEGDSVGVSKKEEVQRVLTDLAGKAAPDDVVLILLIGHGSAQGGEPRFNLPGPDLTAKEYGALLDKFRTQRVAFVNAASASGDFIAALSRKNRVVVTATRSGGEKNETVFAGYFVAAYSADVADADKDGKVSLLEAFDYARREVARFYETNHRLQTEHALIDDDGDGQGSREPSPASGDGAVARRFVIGASGRAPVATSGDSTLAPLYADVRKLEEEIATLRARKDSMKPETYDAQLEDLLVQLSEKNQAIRDATKKP